METTDLTFRPFTVDIAQDALDDLRDRLTRTRWTGELPGVGDDYGVAVASVRGLVDHWLTAHDWRAVEARINSFPQFTTEIDGQRVHLVHVRSPEPDAVPLLLTHGWPQSFVEYLDLVGPLTDPRAHGFDPVVAFDVVIPSLPGFAFSGPTTERGWGVQRTARAWAALMAGLGYDRYVAAGNDGGSLVSPEVGRVDPEHVIGVHVTQVFSFPSGDPAEFENLQPEDHAALEVLQAFWANNSAFNQLQSTQPQTLAFALADSPVGQLAWSTQLFRDGVSAEFAVTNAAIYWLTETAASSARFYYESQRDPEPEGPTTVPLGLSGFANDFASIRPFAERDHATIVSWNVHDTGNHFSTQSAPEVLVEDLRGFAAQVR